MWRKCLKNWNSKRPQILSNFTRKCCANKRKMSGRPKIKENKAVTMVDHLKYIGHYLPAFQIHQKTLKTLVLHSVETSGFFYHSDFTWNQFGLFQKLQYYHFENLEWFEFLENFTLQKMQKCKCVKMADFYFKNLNNWFHVKSDWRKNSEISIQWCEYL